MKRHPSPPNPSLNPKILKPSTSNFTSKPLNSKPLTLTLNHTLSLNGYEDYYRVASYRSTRNLWINIMGFGFVVDINFMVPLQLPVTDCGREVELQMLGINFA